MGQLKKLSSGVSNGRWRDLWMCRGFVIWETLLMKMVERILLLQLESEMDG